MSILIKMIEEATADELSNIWLPLKKRCIEVFPDWDVITVAIERNRDRNQQIDDLINMLNGFRADKQ